MSQLNLSFPSSFDKVYRTMNDSRVSLQLTIPPWLADVSESSSEPKHGPMELCPTDHLSPLLLFNGPSSGASLRQQQSLLTRFQSVPCQLELSVVSAAQVCSQLFENISGPFAFALLIPRLNLLLVGRDRLGRRSLIFQRRKVGFCISSCLMNEDSETCELPVDGIYVFELKQPGNDRDGCEESKRIHTVDDNEAIRHVEATGISSHGLLFDLFPSVNDVCIFFIPWSSPSSPALSLKDLSPQLVGKSFPNAFSVLLNAFHYVLKKEWHNPFYTWLHSRRHFLIQTRHDAAALIYAVGLVQAVHSSVCHVCGSDKNEGKDGTGSSTIAEEARNHSTESTEFLSSVMILFSGGLDSTVLAALSYVTLPTTDTFIELMNICKGSNTTVDMSNESHRVQLPLGGISSQIPPDRLTATSSFCELVREFPVAPWRLCLGDVTRQELNSSREFLRKLILPRRPTVMDRDIGRAIWFASRGKGRIFCCDNRKLAQRLARLSSMSLVASHKDAMGAAEVNSAVSGCDDLADIQLCECLLWEICGQILSQENQQPSPTALSHEELREWLTDSFVNLSVLGKDHAPCLPTTIATLSQRVQKLCDRRLLRKVRPSPDVVLLGIHPQLSQHHWLMDEATRSLHQRLQLLHHPQKLTTVPYDCRSRVLLLGTGADETLGGYARYLQPGKKQKYDHPSKITTAPMTMRAEHFTQERSRDLKRLWKRNLGRDDRIISSSGRESHLPFLDDRLLSLLNLLDLSDLVNLEQPRGFGEKKCLRTIATWLGLTAVAKLPKRAIQFGTRMANKKQKGRDDWIEKKESI